jgi:predicted O-methyltransferase YrrM
MESDVMQTLRRFDAEIETVLSRLHAQSRRELPSLIIHFLRRSFPKWIRGERLTELNDSDVRFLRGKLIALSRDKAEFCYLLCRAIRASRIVEVGTSFGVSTIYLAAAIRDNGIPGDDGRVITCEIDPVKAARARENLDAAGVGKAVELRIGDARDTLKSVSGPIDFLLIDSWTSLARPIVELLKPGLRPGALVACDNTGRFKTEYRDFLDYVREPANGFLSIHVPFTGGLEVAMRN